jgi:hypothetical protein
LTTASRHNCSENGSIASSLTDWFFAGDWLHRRYTYPEIWREGLKDGQFRNSAQMEWSAAVGDYTFVSDPIVSSSSSFAEIGHERNGSFFP